MTEAFRVLAADCPWSFADSLPGPKRGARSHYPCMTVAEICRFPIPDMERDSILFMWRVASMVPEAYEVCKAWGFQPKSEIIWCKTTKHGKRHMGMGHYVRAEHEACIIATRGKGASLIRDRGVRSVFHAPVREHSAKPAAFYELVERLVEGPYVELFARRHRVGWTCLGGEVGKLDEVA